MRGLDPRIRVSSGQQDVDGRVKPGRDDRGNRSENSPVIATSVSDDAIQPVLAAPWVWIASLRSQ
jgi:hypothetical protein